MLRRVGMPLVAIGLSLAMAVSAEALLITPSTTPQWTTDATGNLNANDVETLTGCLCDLTEDYKQNVGGSEEGSFAGSYTTVFNPPADPEDATITWDGPSFITGDHIFLLIKDGSQGPGGDAQYVFDISGWDGKETIDLVGFWPAGGGISHVSIYSDEGGGGNGGSGGFPQVPNPGSLVLLGAGLIAATAAGGAWGFRRRR